MRQETFGEDGSEKVGIRARASQRAAQGEGQVSEEFENQLNLRKGRGNPLSGPVRSIAEPALRFDFSKVRIHTDDEASRMSRQLGARAFTHGTDIFFREGQYAPSSRSGKRLLAHELTHVVQQHSEHCSPMTIQREAGGAEEQIRRDDLLRRLARSPREAQSQWASLSPGEQTVLVQYMTLVYGDTFARRFLLYAREGRRHSIIDITNFPEHSDERLRARGYRLAEVQDNIAYWVHPSGNEAWIMGTGSGESAPASAPQPRTRPLRTRDNVEIHGYRGRAELHPDGTILLFTQGRDNPITFRQQSAPEHSMWSHYEIYDESGQRIDGTATIRISEIFGESAYEEEIDQAVEDALEL